MFDGLRGLCALGLLVVHVAWTARLTGAYTDPPTNLPAAIVINGFQIGVGVFFLMSGLFLYRPFARATIAGTQRPALGPYFLRRVLRLLPAYYLVMITCLLVLNYSSIDGIWYVLRPVLLLQNYDFVWMAGMDITWTVPTEVQWYLALPLMFFATHWYARKGKDAISRANRLMIPIPLLTIFGFGWMYYIHRPSMGMFPPEFWWPFGVAANIAIGMAFAIWSARAQVLPSRPPALFTVAGNHPALFWFGALVVFAINCAEPFGRPGYGDYDTIAGAMVFYVLFIAFCGLLVAPMVAPNAKDSRVINAIAGNPVIVFIGRISYGVYLWHFVVMNLYLQNGSIFGAPPKGLPELRGTVGFWELEAAVIAGTIVIATLSYYLVERPLMNWGERRIQARQARKNPPVAPRPTELKQPVAV